MKESIKIFKSPQFGDIRTAISPTGEPLFCLADLCKAINVNNNRNVAKRLDEDDVRRMDITDVLGRNQQALFVTESGMYEVLLRSDSEKAKPPTQKAIDMGLIEVKKSTYTTPDGNTFITNTPKITGKGQIYFVNRVLYDLINDKVEKVTMFASD